MIKVREKTKKGTKRRFDSLVVEIPTDFAVSHGLPKNSLATLTVDNGKIVSEVIPYSADDEREVDKFLKEFPGLDKEMKSVGD
jgi:hypothetical protein